MSVVGTGQIGLVTTLNAPVGHDTLNLTRGRVADRLTRVLVAPITTTVRGLATEVALGEAEGVTPGCVANLDNAQLVPVDVLLRRAGRVNTTRWPEFCTAMAKVMAG